MTASALNIAVPGNRPDPDSRSVSAAGPNDVEILHRRYLDLAASWRFDEARPVLWRALQLGQRHPEYRRATDCVKLSLVREQVRLGECERAFDSLRELRTTAEEIADQGLLLMAAGCEAQLLLDLGRADEALRCGNAALAQLGLFSSSRSQGDGAALFVVAVAAAALEKGELLQADALLAACGGRQDEANEIRRSVTARLDTARGKHADVVRRLRGCLTEAPVTLDGRLSILAALVEAQLWANSPSQAVATLECVGVAMFGAAAPTSVMLGVLTLAMRACADMREQARASQDRELENAACRAAAQVRRSAHDMNLAEVYMHSPRLTARVESWEWHAEGARFDRQSDQAEWWRTVAQRWSEHEIPHRAGYAWLRCAQALIDRGEPVEARRCLQQAQDAAGDHQPLKCAIADTAGWVTPIDSRASPLVPTPSGTFTNGAKAVDHRVEEPTRAAQQVQLTKREREVMDLIGAGHTAVAAAHRLGISSRTVSKHLEHIYSKIGCDNRVSAVTQLRG